MDFKSIFSKKFVDLDNSFFKNPVTKDIAKKTNIAAIKQSCLNLLQTNRGERPFHPEIGTHIRALLFEQLTPQISLLIKEYIKTTLENYEPRIQIYSIIVTDIPEELRVQITLEVKIIGQNDTISFDLFIERTR